MTLIFHTCGASVPVLVGDLLISGDEEAGKSFRMPGYVNGILDRFPEGSGFVPKRIERKTRIINDRLAIGVSDERMCMRMFLKDVSERFGGVHDFSMDELRDFFDGYGADPENAQVLNGMTSIIMFQADGADRFVVAGKRTGGSLIEKSTTSFGKLLAIGSGNETLAEEIARHDDTKLLVPDPAAVDPVYVTLGRHLSLIAQLHQIDSLTGRSLLEYWGGGYEIIYKDKDGKYRYLDDYTMVFWAADLGNPRADLKPLGLVRHERRGDASLLYVYENERFDIFICEDITGGGPKELELKWSEISFNSGIFVNNVLAHRDGRVVNLLNWLDRHEDGYTGSVSTEIREDRRLEIRIRSGLDKKIIDMVRRSGSA